MDDEIVRQLKAAVRGEVAFDPLTRQLYSTDASHYRVVPHGVVLPRDADDIAAVLEVAAQYDVKDQVPLSAYRTNTIIAHETIGGWRLGQGVTRQTKVSAVIYINYWKCKFICLTWCLCCAEALSAK